VILVKMFFYLPALEAWLHGKGQAEDVVVALKSDPSSSDKKITGNYRDYVPTKLFYQDWEGKSRMAQFIEDIKKGHCIDRDSAWLEDWEDLLIAVRDRISQFSLNITTITCPREYAISTYLMINQSATPMSDKDWKTATDAAQGCKTKVYDDLLEHTGWRDAIAKYPNASLPSFCLRSKVSQVLSSTCNTLRLLKMIGLFCKRAL